MGTTVYVHVLIGNILILTVSILVLTGSILRLVGNVPVLECYSQLRTLC